MARYFFSGIAGAGMNPLAQLMRAWGHDVSGSDRGFDQGKQAELKTRLIASGITVVPQDGAGVQPGIERFVYSTAVEQETPEVRRAKELGIELVPRPRLLAEVARMPSLNDDQRPHEKTQNHSFESHHHDAPPTA